MALDPGSTLGSFEISGLLGAGGMGEVYRARDSKLGREVAIKVLPGEFAKDEDRLARFEREARTLASLDHSGIAAIHDLQEAGGMRFLVMQLVDGPTLADRLKLGPLDLDTALPLFQQIAEALEYAHDQGVVHRDLKPANIKITKHGKAKILDFGLAKAFEEPSGSNEDSAQAPTLAYDAVGRTSEGRILGTPAYMSPEQARGEAVDKRTDVWAFGCCLYEALCGRRPFVGRTSSDVIAEILKSEPDWSRLPEGTPSHILLLLRRCLEKDARRRLSSMGDLAITFEETSSELRQVRSDLDISSASRVAARRRPRRLGFAAVLLAGLAVAVTALVLVLDRGGEDAPPAAAPAERKIERIAVLPFTNISGDRDQDWFVDGMTVALVTELARIDALTVMSRTSAMQYKDNPRPVREMASQLGADALVEGSVVRVGDDVSITASLIDGVTEQTIWSDRYDGTADDVLNLQSQIAVAVAREIDVALTPEEEAELTRARNVNPNALDAYLKGVHELGLARSDSRERAVSYFKEALRIEPDYALAHAQIAISLVQQFSWGLATRAEVRDAAEAAEQAALDLDPDLCLAWSARALRVQNMDWDWTRAETYHKRAIEADPENTEALSAYAYGLALYGDRHDEAIELGRRVVELDPSHLMYQIDRAEVLISAGRFDEAAGLLERVFRADPENFPLAIFRSYLGILTGHHEQAAREASRALDISGDKRHMEYLATAYALGGRTAEARAALGEFEELSKSTYIQRAELGMVHLALGDHDEAYELFEQGLREREIKLFWLKHTGFFDTVDVDAKLEKLLEQVRSH